MKYEISKSLFLREVILKIVYMYHNVCDISIEENDNNYVLNVKSNNNYEFCFEKFNKKLQEQQLREILNAQFGVLRDSMYKKAFEYFEVGV